jgi:pimeloyl-ACP methyl ester carboxylesterase
MLYFTIFLAMAIVCGGADFAAIHRERRQNQGADNKPSSSHDEALGIALDGYPYPFTVQFLPLEVDNQPVRMAYMDVPSTGRSNGHTVVLLHGKNFYGYYWEATAKALAAEGYRVVIPDQVGFGKSSKPDVHYTFEMLASNTARLLDSLGIKQEVVVGHSTGGMLAVRFALTYPERVTRLILEDPVGLEDYRQKIPAQSTATLFRAEMEQTPEKLRAFFMHYFANPIPELYGPHVEIASRVLLSGEYPRWAKASALTYQMIYGQPVRGEFGRVKPPTLLVVGEKDRTVVMRNYASPEVAKSMGNYPELGKEAARDIPNCQLIVFQGVGHVPHLEAPEKFNQAVIAFIKPASRQAR